MNSLPVPRGEKSTKGKTRKGLPSNSHKGNSISLTKGKKGQERGEYRQKGKVIIVKKKKKKKEPESLTT